MNKLLLSFCLFIGYGTFCSCSSDDETEKSHYWDLRPFSFTILPIDENGNNIMKMLDNVKVTAEWRGNVYEKDSSIIDYPFNTRAWPGIFYGLMANDTSMVFGEFDRGQSYENEIIIIKWNNGFKSDTIVFSHELKWVKDDKGVKVPESNFDIKLNKQPAKLEMVITKKL